MDLLRLRRQFDAVVQKVLPYSRCLHLTFGYLLWVIGYGFSLTSISILLLGFLVALAIELLQKYARIGTFEWLDIVYTEVGILLPTIAVMIRNYNG